MAIISVYRRAVFSTAAEEPRTIGREMLLTAGEHARIFRSLYPQDVSDVQYGDIVLTGARQVRVDGSLVVKYVYEKVWLLADLPDGGTAINRRDFAAGSKVRVVPGEEVSC